MEQARGRGGGGGGGCGEGTGEGRLWTLLQCGEREDGGCGAVRHRVRHSRRSMPRACDPPPPLPARATVAACSWRCVRAQRHEAERHPQGLVSLEDVCAAGCAVQKGGRAGCEEGELGEHAAIAEERAVLRAVLPCCPDSLARHDHRGCGQALSWGSATQHGAGCGVQVCGGVGSRGSLEPGAMEQALRTPSPLLRRESVRWWGVAMGGAPERGDGEGAVHFLKDHVLHGD